jgi:hypothetical protein
VPNLGVDPIGEVEDRGTTRKRKDITPRREAVDVIGVEIDLDGIEELPW